MTTRIDDLLVFDEFSIIFPQRASPVISRKMSTIMWSIFLFGLAPMVASLMDLDNVGEVLESYKSLSEPLGVFDPYSQRHKRASSIDHASEFIEKYVSPLNEMEDQYRPESVRQSSYKRIHRPSALPEVDRRLNALAEPVALVKNLWSNFCDCLQNPKKSCAWLEEFAENVTSNRENSLRNEIDKIYNIMEHELNNPKISRYNFAELIVQEAQMTEFDSCDLFVPAHDFLHDIFQTIEKTELKAYTMILYGYSFSERLKDANFDDERTIQYEGLKRRLRRYAFEFQNSMSLLPRTLRRCDIQTDLIRGKTFFEFQRFISTVIVEEPALNTKRSCRGKCLISPERRMFLDDKDLNQLCEGPDCVWPSERCDGSVTECKSLGMQVKLCENKNATDPRRYNWFVNEKDIVYGDNSTVCPNPLQRANWFFQSMSVNCERCACTCVEDNPLKRGNTIRTISLKEVSADTSRGNMLSFAWVVTGVRFRKTHGVIHIEIETGQLMGYGRILDISVAWDKPRDSTFYRSGMARNDVFEFNSKNRAINLDELHVPENHALTGLRFVKIMQDEPDTYAIGLEIQATPFNRKTGKLDVPNQAWISPAKCSAHDFFYCRPRAIISQPSNLRNPLKLSKAHIIKLSKNPDFVPNKQIQLERTGLIEDAGQTVIPLLDGREISARPAIPLAGINLFHNSVEGYGGFLSFQIISIDRSDDIILP